MRKRSLGLVSPDQEGLGRPTIMEPLLARKHGVRYVHAAVAAIDIDRVRDVVDERDDDDAWPFGWEVLLTSAMLEDAFDPRTDEGLALLEDLWESTVEPAGDEPRLGEQLPFAVFDLVSRGVWPASLRKLFFDWKARPRELMRDLEKVRTRTPDIVATLAKQCLAEALTPGLAPPTLAWLERRAAR